MQTTPAKRNLILFVIGAVLFVLTLTYRLVRHRQAVTPAPVADLPRADSGLAAPPTDTMARFPPRAAGASPVTAPMAKPLVPAASAPEPKRAASAASRPAQQPDEARATSADVPTDEPVRQPAKEPACDQIVMRDGDLIDVHVTEVGVSEVRYNRCGRKDGPVYVVLKRDILSIRYPNGEVERFAQ